MSIVVSVAPNGGRLSKLDHPRLPLSIAELAAEARACSAAGARLMHFHVRGEHGEHSLDAGLYREALREIEPQAGGMILQISTESRGVGKRDVGKNAKDSSSSSDDTFYSPHEQAQCIFASNCRAASVSFSEICAEGAGAGGEGDGAGKNSAFARSFYAEAAERGIHLQHILYSAREAARFQRALAAGIVVRARGHKLCVLFVFGKDASKDSTKGTARGEADSASFASFIASCLQAFSEESLGESRRGRVSAGRVPMVCLCVWQARAGTVNTGELATAPSSKSILKGILRGKFRGKFRGSSGF